jgi:AbrB family looped-hinge helix DNA binding protein
VKSKITDKFQITIPKQIRELLKLERNDSLEWRIEGGKVTVEAVSKPFPACRGSVKTGPGNIRHDIETARDAIAEKCSALQIDTAEGL